MQIFCKMQIIFWSGDNSLLPEFEHGEITDGDLYTIVNIILEAGLQVMILPAKQPNESCVEFVVGIDNGKFRQR